MAAAASNAVGLAKPKARRVCKSSFLSCPDLGIIVVQAELSPKIAYTVDDVRVTGEEEPFRYMAISTTGPDAAGRGLVHGGSVNFRIGNVGLHRVAGSAETIGRRNAIDLLGAKRRDNAGYGAEDEGEYHDLLHDGRSLYPVFQSY